MATRTSRPSSAASAQPEARNRHSAGGFRRPALHRLLELYRRRFRYRPRIIVGIGHDAPYLTHLHADISRVIEREDERFAKIALDRVVSVEGVDAHHLHRLEHRLKHG